jgi:hypothetical protein
MMTENPYGTGPGATGYPDTTGAETTGFGTGTGTTGYPETTDYPGTAGTGTTGYQDDTSKKDVAKEEAANVAGHAAGAAQNVAGTAKTEAKNVAYEAKNSAKDLLHQAKSDLTSQAGTQQTKAAEGIRTISSQLRSMADAPDQQGVASDLIRQAADRSESVASWLDNRDPGSLLDEVKSFARQRPGTFLLLAAGAGMLAGRLGRSLQAGAPRREPAQDTQAPFRNTPPSLRSPKAACPEPPAHRCTTPPQATPTTYAETVYGEPARPGFDAPGSAGVPLRDPEDPYTEGGGRPL